MENVIIGILINIAIIFLVLIINWLMYNHEYKKVKNELKITDELNETWKKHSHELCKKNVILLREIKKLKAYSVNGLDLHQQKRLNIYRDTIRRLENDIQTKNLLIESLNKSSAGGY